MQRSSSDFVYGFFFKWERANTVPHYHKLCILVSHIWGNRRGRHMQNVMDKPCPGKTTFLIMLSPLPDMYEFYFKMSHVLKFHRAPHLRMLIFNLTCSTAFLKSQFTFTSYCANSLSSSSIFSSRPTLCNLFGNCPVFSGS